MLGGVLSSLLIACCCAYEMGWINSMALPKFLSFVPASHVKEAHVCLFEIQTSDKRTRMLHCNSQNNLQMAE